MGGNKAAYDLAYKRALEGKSSRSVWAFLTTYFEDEYTRQSRARGERDGTAARAAATGGAPAATDA
ncbi:MAG TPA: hypothetical protein VF771_06555 [Longimicrobiaceae bacterium]